MTIVRALIADKIQNKNAFCFLFFYLIRSGTCRRKTEEKTASEHRHDGHDAVVRGIAGRRDNHIVVHVQPATAVTDVGHGGRHRGHGGRDRPVARGTV